MKSNQLSSFECEDLTELFDTILYGDMNHLTNESMESTAVECVSEGYQER
mgnify:CR=1 FL=1|jgi:hypothetical protein